MDHMEKSAASNLPQNKSYNCCQSVLVRFSHEMGLTPEQAEALGRHFGSGMHHGSTCGALSGGLMVLGALGYGGKDAAALIQDFREKHGATDCPTLLKTARDRGVVRDDHCGSLIQDMIQTLSDLQSRQ